MAALVVAAVSSSSLRLSSAALSSVAPIVSPRNLVLRAGSANPRRGLRQVARAESEAKAAEASAPASETPPSADTSATSAATEPPSPSAPAPASTAEPAPAPAPASTADPATETAAAASAVAASEAVEAPAGFVPAEPKRFQIAEGQLGDILTAALPSLLRLGTGAFTTTYKAKVESASSVAPGEYAVGPILGRDIVESSSFPKRPEQPIILYEFEGCPFCRKVREAVSALDLDVLFYPCPQGSPNFRPKAIELGGKKQFPYMVDPNTGVSMYESNDIIKYLTDTYGDGTIPFMLRPGLLTDITAGLAGIGRIMKGSRYTPAKQPKQPLDLWAYEVSPFCKIVREVLVELELPHVYHSTPRGSAKRSALIERTGRFQVPYLEDPNTGVKTFESKAIIDYLKQTYALPPTA